jgi:adenylate kinase
MLNIVLFGPPGAGKGTQAQKICNHYNLVHLSTGDILRAEKLAETELGKEAKTYADRGELVPDMVVINIIEAQLDKNSDAHGYVFDGFPRTVPQAEALDMMLAVRKTAITMTLALEVDNEELTKRIISRGKESGRADDQDKEIVKTRINEYNLKTAPLKEYYSKQGKLFTINGIGNIDEITQLLHKTIDNYSS